MRIVVVSGSPWTNDNSFGNTFTNLFSDFPEVEIANVYCRYGMPEQNPQVSCYFQITEMDLLKKRPGRAFVREAVPKSETKEQTSEEKSRYDFFRRHRLQVFFWAREILWSFGKWDTLELRNFIDKFQPDLIYLAMYNSIYILNMGLYLRRRTGQKMIGLIADDYYTLKQFSYSPLFWIDRFLKRRKLREVARQSSFLHVITEKQKAEYEKALHVECRVFRKSMDFSDSTRQRHELHTPFRFVYTGNLGSGRWKVLAEIGEALDRVCQGQAELLLYSQTPLDHAMERAFAKAPAIRFMGGVGAVECSRIQEDADVLVLVESRKLKDRLATRLSLSTKVVDYLHTGNCILSYGPREQAGQEYLRENRAAITASDKDELEEQLRMLSAERIREYGDAAWALGKKNHDKKVVKEQFYRDLLEGAGVICES